MNSGLVANVEVVLEIAISHQACYFAYFLAGFASLLNSKLVERARVQ